MSEDRERLHSAFWEISNVLEGNDLPVEIRHNLTTALERVYKAFIEMRGGE